MPHPELPPQPRPFAGQSRFQRRRARAHARQARRVVDPRRADPAIGARPRPRHYVSRCGSGDQSRAAARARAATLGRAGHRHCRRRGAEPAQAPGRGRRDRDPAQARPERDGLFRAVSRREQISAPQSAEARLAIGDRKRRGRRFLIKAVVALVQARCLDDEDAYAELRRESMRRRLDLEEFCAALFEPGSDFPSAWPAGARAFEFT